MPATSWLPAASCLPGLRKLLCSCTAACCVVGMPCWQLTSNTRSMTADLNHHAPLHAGDALLLVATDGVTDVLGDDDALGVALDAMHRVSTGLFVLDMFSHSHVFTFSSGKTRSSRLGADGCVLTAAELVQQQMMQSGTHTRCNKAAELADCCAGAHTCVCTPALPTPRQRSSPTAARCCRASQQRRSKTRRSLLAQRVSVAGAAGVGWGRGCSGLLVHTFCL